jgi:Fe-S-cluster-containing hydrogenase component 2
VRGDMLLTTGVPSKEQIESRTPPRPRREKGPFVMIECFQEIPCDPCYYSCRFGAIQEFESINEVPQVDWSKCTGCGVCVAACPGLAIFVVDETFSDAEGLIAIPYEFAPLPEKGDRVFLLDRAGVSVGEGFVHRVLPGKKPQGTPVVWVRVPKELSLTVRNIGFEKGGVSHG